MPIPAGSSPAPMSPSGPLVYDPVLSRVRLSVSGLFDGSPVRVERSTNQVNWSTVRGGGALLPVGGQIPLDDYEFAADVPNYYRIVGPRAWDTFTRTVSIGWDVAESGQLWTTSGGSAADHSVNGTQGLQSYTSVGVFRVATIDLGVTDHLAVFDITDPVVPTGNLIVHQVLGRISDLSNYYVAGLAIAVGGAATLNLQKRVGGTGSAISSGVSVGTHAAGDTWRVALDVNGSTLLAKAWKPATGSDPGWQVTATDTSLTSGTQCGVQSRLESGNTNTLPVVIAHDNLVVTAPETTIYTGSLTPTLDGVWLKSVARPFLNRKVTVFDVSSVERRSRTGVFDVIGRSFPVAVNDVRGSRRWTLYVRTQTLAEADNFDLVLASGDTLLVHVPAGSPVPGGYVTVGDTSEANSGPLLSRRIFALPCTEVAVPGPDVVGSPGNWQTALNTYATWTDVLAAHPTWSSLLELIGSPTDVVVP